MPADENGCWRRRFFVRLSDDSFLRVLGLVVMESTRTHSSSPIEAWLQTAKNGSNSALGHVLEACRGYMLLLANRALDEDLRLKTAPSDLVQETFFYAQRDFPAFLGTTEKELFAWLTQILINRLRNSVRHYKGTKKRDVRREVAMEQELDRMASELFAADDTPSALVAALEEEKQIRECLAKMPELDREVLILRTWEGRSFTEIGEILDRSSEAVRKQWSRAVERLGRMLEDGK